MEKPADVLAAARVLREARRRVGLSQEALAEKAGLSVTCIQKIEYGIAAPHRPTREVLASILEIDEPALRGVDREFADWLRARRVEVGWSQERLAAEAGITQAYVSQLERGQAIPRPVVAQRINDALERWEEREARRLYESGKTFAEVGNVLRFSFATARRRVLAAGGLPRQSPLPGGKLSTETRRKMSATRRGKPNPHARELARGLMATIRADRRKYAEWGLKLMQARAQRSARIRGGTIQRWGRLLGSASLEAARHRKGEAAAVELGTAAIALVSRHPNADRTSVIRVLVERFEGRSAAKLGNGDRRPGRDPEYRRARARIMQRLERAHQLLGEPPELASLLP